MPQKLHRLLRISLTVVVALICLRGFLDGRMPPLHAQDVMHRSASSSYSDPTLSGEDRVQDNQIFTNTEEIGKLRERLAKQKEAIDDLKFTLATINGKLEASSNFWSMQNGGIGVGILAMLGFQVTPIVKSARRKRRDEDE